MSLALPWSDLDHWPHLAQADQDWAGLPGKARSCFQPDPDLAGRYLVLALSGSGPGMVGYDRLNRALTLDGLAILDLKLA